MTRYQANCEDTSIDKQWLIGWMVVESSFVVLLQLLQPCDQMDGNLWVTRVSRIFSWSIMSCYLGVRGENRRIVWLAILSVLCVLFLTLSSFQFIFHVNNSFSSFIHMKVFIVCLFLTHVENNNERLNTIFRLIYFAKELEFTTVYMVISLKGTKQLKLQAFSRTNDTISYSAKQSRHFMLQRVSFIPFEFGSMKTCHTMIVTLKIHLVTGTMRNKVSGL